MYGISTARYFYIKQNILGIIVSKIQLKGDVTVYLLLFCV
jgi:hypothetical protein